jgi:hypothetical protein
MAEQGSVSPPRFLQSSRRTLKLDEEKRVGVTKPETSVLGVSQGRAECASLAGGAHFFKATVRHCRQRPHAHTPTRPHAHTPTRLRSRRQSGVDFVDGGSLVFTGAVAMGNSFHEVEHRRNKKDRDEGRREHPADNRCSQNLPRCGA